MAINELRELRASRQLPTKDMVAVVQKLYPKYDRTMLSKCEHSEEYGVSIQPDAMKALYDEFAPELREVNKRRKDGHRLSCRISCRLENDDYTALQQCITADGFKDMQSWLTFTVREYIKEKE